MARKRKQNVPNRHEILAQVRQEIRDTLNAMEGKLSPLQYMLVQYGLDEMLGVLSPSEKNHLREKILNHLREASPSDWAHLPVEEIHILLQLLKEEIREALENMDPDRAERHWMLGDQILKTVRPPERENDQWQLEYLKALWLLQQVKVLRHKENVVEIRQILDDLEPAIRDLRHTARPQGKVEDLYGEFLMEEGYLLLASGKAKQARNRLDRAVKALRRAGNKSLRKPFERLRLAGEARLALARAALECSDFQTARHFAQDLIDAAGFLVPVFHLEAFRLLAQIALKEGNPQETREFLGKALERVPQTENLPPSFLPALRDTVEEYIALTESRKDRREAVERIGEALANAFLAMDLDPMDSLHPPIQQALRDLLKRYHALVTELSPDVEIHPDLEEWLEEYPG